MSASKISQQVEAMMQQGGIKNIRVLAEQADIPYGTIVGIIYHGTTPRHTTLKKLADFFNVPLSDLSAITRKPAKPTNPLADTLNHLMQIHYYGQRDLQRLTGITQASIYRILKGETRNPSHQILRKLADCFGITTEQLIGKDDLPAKYKNKKPSL